MIIVLALGSNIGNRKTNILNALDRIEKELSVNIIKSNFFESRPYGDIQQENFCNLVCEFSIDLVLKPQKLLTICKSIENQMGRIKNEHWGPRLIDIDIIFMEYEVINDNNLTIPHKEYMKRCFVLEPLKTLPSYTKFKNHFNFKHNYEIHCWPMNAEH